MRRLAAAAMLAGLVLAGCGHTDRPEGIVERWFTSLNQGSAGRPGQYAPELLSQGVLPNWRQCEPGVIDLIEVGRGGEDGLRQHRGRGRGTFGPRHRDRAEGDRVGVRDHGRRVGDQTPAVDELFAA